MSQLGNLNPGMGKQGNRETSEVLLLLSGILKMKYNWISDLLQCNSVNASNNTGHCSGSWAWVKQLGEKQAQRHCLLLFCPLSHLLSALYSWGLYFISCFFFYFLLQVLWELLRHTLPLKDCSIYFFFHIHINIYIHFLPVASCSIPRMRKRKRSTYSLNIQRVKVAFHSQQP